MIVDKKQNILVVHNYYQIPGGEDTVVANEKKMLEDNGHKVILYSRHNEELKNFSFIRKLALPFTTIFNFSTFKDIKRIIREEKIDVVHVHNTLNLISPAVYYAALSCKVPVVQTVHNFRLVCPGATFYRDGQVCEDCIKQGLGCAVKHGCYRGSRLQTLVCVVATKFHRMTKIYSKINYICLTEFNKEKLLSLKQIKLEQVFVKPNFVSTLNDTIIPYYKRKNQYIFVGRLEKLKGVDVLLEAWKEIQNMQEVDTPKLLICGIGPMEDWCKDYIEKNNLTSVELKGFVPNDKVRKLIAQSKALILPTQCYEGFPMTIAESYNVGTPVIGSNIGNVKSLIQNGITGELFDMRSSKELVDAIVKCSSCNSYDMLDVKDKYSLKNNYDVLMKIYNSVK